MAWQDDVAVKRQELAAQKASQNLHDENIDAVLGSGENIIGATKNLAKSSDIDSVINQLKEVQLATMLGAAKPSVILTDQTDLGDKIAELGTKIDQAISAIKGLDTSDNDSEEIRQLKSLNTLLQDYIKSEKDDNAMDIKSGKALLAAIKSIDIKPNVTVTAPKVSVPAPRIDLSPLQTTLERYFNEEESEEKLDLDDFRAQDIDNTNPDMQYVGFVAPNGSWYIIENDIKGNKLRYVFGVNNYEEAFNNAPMYTYSLLNEAIHALSA